MQRASRYRIVSIALCVALGAFIALAACSNYEEGERCELLNGNEDCASPLQCTPAAELGVAFRSSDRCCPVDRSKATTTACMQPEPTIGGDAAPPDANTGPAPDASIDARDAADTSTLPDTGPDADAADDGG